MTENELGEIAKQFIDYFGKIPTLEMLRTLRRNVVDEYKEEQIVLVIEAITGWGPPPRGDSY